MKNIKAKNIAIVHDYLYTYGGAERTLEVFHELFPEAPIYTTYFVEKNFPEYFKTLNIKESILGKLFIKNTWFRRFYTLLCPIVVKFWNFSDYDLVISISAGPAKGIRKFKNTIHVSYILTPPLNEWGILKPRFRKYFYLWYSKWMDKMDAKKPDKMIAISTEVKERIKNFYNRDSEVIFPPVEINKLQSYLEGNETKEDYFVMCGRLEIYKGVSIVAKILDKNNLKMKIIGRGDDQKNLVGLSENIEYLGFVSDEEKAKVLAKAKALIMWNEEDFGINMVEALACGTPVIAFGKGGAKDIVLDKENGVLFQEQSEKSLLQAIETIEKLNLNSQNIKSSASKFSKENFKKEILNYIEKL